MRRPVAYALLTAGLSLVFVAPLLSLYVGPRVAKVPLDVDVTSTAFGSGSYFSERLLHVVTGAQLENVTQAKGDPRSSTHDVAVIDVLSQTSDRQRGQFDSSYSIVALDRTSAYAVDCCGAKPPATGLTFKFPFGTRRVSYPFWDNRALQAFPARYVRTDLVEGLRTYVFVTSVPRTLIGTQTVPGFLVKGVSGASVRTSRFYRATTTLWVEPSTGGIVKADQRSAQWLEDQRGTTVLTLADVRFALSPATVRANVHRVSAAADQLRLLRTRLPIAGLVLGVGLLLISWRLLRSDAEPVSAQDAPGEVGPDEPGEAAPDKPGEAGPDEPEEAGPDEP